MDPQYFNEIQQWYVVFQDRRKPRTRCIHWLLHDRFVHCLLVRPVNDQQTLVIDPAQWGVMVAVVDSDVESFLTEKAARTTAIVSYVADYRKLEGYYPRGPYTCVTLLKAILGLKKCALLQTPFSLYKYLLKSERTTVVKPYIPYVRDFT